MTKNSGQPQQELQAALDTIVRILVGDEIKSIRDSNETLKLGLATKIDNVSKDASAAFDALQEEFTAQANNLSATLDELLKQIQQENKSRNGAVDQIHERLDAVKSEMTGFLNDTKQKTEKDIASSIERISKRIEANEMSLVQHEQKLGEQEDEQTRVTELMGNMSRVFSGIIPGGGMPPVEKQKSDGKVSGKQEKKGSSKSTEKVDDEIIQWMKK